jgi:hypothetical protein
MYDDMRVCNKYTGGVQIQRNVRNGQTINDGNFKHLNDPARMYPGPAQGIGELGHLPRSAYWLERHF